MNTEELKIRQMTNQYLLTPADRLTVVRDLCGIQAQFMVNAIHSLRIRCNDFDAKNVAKGLVKNWTVRGTVHVFAESDLGLFIRCNNGADYRRRQWSGYTFWNRRDQWALSPERQKYFSDIIISAIGEKPYTRDDLKILCRERGMTESEESCMFDQWGGGIRELCERGFMNYAVQEKKAYIPSPDFCPIPDEEAKLEIARRYFTNIAPATAHDAMYFLGAKLSEVKKSGSISCPSGISSAGGGPTTTLKTARLTIGIFLLAFFLRGLISLCWGIRKRRVYTFLPSIFGGFSILRES